MKKMISTALAATAAAVAVTTFAAAPTVVFDGETMSFDAEPYIVEGRTMVPFRAIFEKADAQVNWDEDTKTVIAVQGDGTDAKSIVLQIGQNEAFVNGEKKPLDVPAEIVSDRTFVPLRFIMEELGADVAWNQDSYTVTITSK